MADDVTTQERWLKVTENAPTFDTALARAVQIVEAEGFAEPGIEVKPQWTYGDGENGTLDFTVVVYGTIR